jgi:hypothetical protein
MYWIGLEFFVVRSRASLHGYNENEPAIEFVIPIISQNWI